MPLWAQVGRPAYLSTPPPAATAPTTAQSPLKSIRLNAPAPNDIAIHADYQEADGQIYHLRGRAEVETSDMLLKADEIDYNRDTGDAEARGHVRFEDYVKGEKLNASRVEYNVDEQTGKFFDVSGTKPPKISARPGLLTTSNPFYFQGEWAERQKDKYILYNGFVTDCKMPSPWWILKGPKFDIIPEDRALAYHMVFWLRLPGPGAAHLPGPTEVHTPLMYMPVFKKVLSKNPRQSGFLAPNAGNSSRRGKMVGIGYYWAINRSYDLLYRFQYFTIRGPAHNVDFRGKVNARTDFGVNLYGVNDRGVMSGGQLVKQGGFIVSGGGRSDLGHGWTARGEFNYLSSFVFRQNFTESFHEAIFAESRSTAFITKHWSSFAANIVVDRDEVYQFETAGETTPDANAKVITRKLPEFQFLARDRQISDKFPIWVSFDSSAGLYHRAEPLFTTSQFMDRVNIEPRVMTNFQWRGFSLTPSVSGRATQYGESFSNNRDVASNTARTSRDLDVDLQFPSLARIFNAPKWMHATKLKHVIEPRAIFRDVGGVTDFNRIIRIDTTDLITNTRQLELSLTNRLYKKNADGNVEEVLTWQVAQVRYFDPTFGGAVVPGQRNVILSSVDVTGYAFIDQYRNYSPVVSVLRYNHIVSVDWRADYDPLRKRLVNSGLSAGFRRDKYFINAGHSMVHDDPVLAPSQNQFNATLGIGNDNRRGWNAGTSVFYDYRKHSLTYMSSQITYNTDCCGYSVQYRRFNFGTRDESQYRFAFAISNFGSFGTLKRQERLF